MRRKFYYFQRVERSLYTILVVLLISLLTQDHHSSARLVNGNLLAQQNGSLPGLSERANSVNSRYLSAASTASLAAATVAAANGAQSTSNNNNQDANRNFLLHQQQQQQQAQINTAGSGQINQPQNQQQQQQQQQQPQQAQVQQQVTGLASPSITVANQVPQFNSAQAQQVTNTPVMSTTFTFNPITGQFVPSELSTGSLLTPTGAQQSFNNQFFNQNPQQQQQLFANPYGQSSNPYATSFNQQRSNPFLNQYQNPYQQVGLNPYGIQQQRPQTNQFVRRNGYGVGPQQTSSSRLGSNYGGQQQQQQSDDDFFQQQLVTNGGNNFLGDLNNFGGLESSAAFGNNLLPGNSYLIPNNHQQHLANNQQQQQQQQQGYNQEHQIVSQSSSVSPAIVATPLGPGFSAAFTGPPPGDYKTSDQCLSADNRHGTCYQASECIKRGGTPMGKCGAQTSEFSGSSYVCCLFDVTCGQFAAERFVYFRNPNYPNTYDQSRMCRAKIGKLDKGVCQFRLDLLRFDVAKPTNGNCSNDMFVVSGQNENYVIPKICGLNDGQHYYVGVDESGVITLHMMMMGYYRRNFEILISQIPCRSDYAAPAHCLQYYMGTHGTIKSFNYDDEQLLGSQQQQQLGSYDQLADSTIAGPTAPYGLQLGGHGLQQRQQQLQLAAAFNGSPQRLINVYGGGGGGVLANLQDQFGGYPNDLDYTMCIRKESGFCSITYQLSRGEQGLQPFAVGHSLFGGANDTSGASTGGWHPVSTECRDDYLLIGGVRLCSGAGSGSYQSGFGDMGASIQFAQNGSVLNSAGVAGHHHLQQQLQAQYHNILQQLARLQQQQQTNGSFSNNANGLAGNGQSANSISQQQQQQQQLIGNQNNANNLEQQQAALTQQALMVQQQLSILSTNGGHAIGNQNNRYQQSDANQQYSDLQGGAIITDTTSGPFILRFVSNMARNAKGFHIDYRQNPCK